MRIKKSCYDEMMVPDETVGHFGKVRLVKKPGGKYELVGGTVDAQATVRKWCERYAAFVVFVESTDEELVLAV